MAYNYKLLLLQVSCIITLQAVDPIQDTATHPLYYSGSQVKEKRFPGLFFFLKAEAQKTMLNPTSIDIAPAHMWYVLSILILLSKAQGQAWPQQNGLVHTQRTVTYSVQML